MMDSSDTEISKKLQENYQKKLCKIGNKNKTMYQVLLQV